jgi:hypothetical protein
LAAGQRTRSPAASGGRVLWQFGHIVGVSLRLRTFKRST